jgi:hypothetical protein
MERYDSVTDTWEPTADMLVGRHSCGAATIGPEHLVDDLNLFDSLIAKADRNGP